MCVIFFFFRKGIPFRLLRTPQVEMSEIVVLGGENIRENIHCLVCAQPSSVSHLKGSFHGAFVYLFMGLAVV